MHITIVTPYTLQGSIFASGLKHQNIESTICSPNNLHFADLRTNAIVLPHHTKKDLLQKVFELIKNISREIPLIFIGTSHKLSIKESQLKKYLSRAIFLDESLSNIEIANLIREMLIRTDLKQEEKIEIGTLTLDCKIRYLVHKNKAFALTKKEFFLLELLANNLGRITTRESIMDYVWDKRNFVAQNTIDVYISRLRKKIHTKSGSPKIETIPCLGYKLTI